MAMTINSDNADKIIALGHFRDIACKALQLSTNPAYTLWCSAPNYRQRRSTSSIASAMHRRRSIKEATTMRITKYEFPKDMPIRDCYDAWMKGSEFYEAPPKDMSDGEIEAQWPRTRECAITRAKQFLKMYGGQAWTEHIERDGSVFEITPIHVKGNNTYRHYNRHL